MKPLQTKALTLTVLLISIFSFACQKENSGQGNSAGKSSVNIFLTDDPSLNFDKVLLDITKVEVKVEDDSEQQHESEHQQGVDDNDQHGETSGGWMSVPIHPGIYDILRFRNGLDTLFGSASFENTRALRKVRITLGTGSSVVLNGVSIPLTIHNNDNIIVLKIDESTVAINSGGLTNFWIDFDAGSSIRRNGNDLELKPNCKVFSKEKSGGIEGIVLPGNAAAIVMAINGTDTLTAKPEDSGEFKFLGLKPGSYTLVYHATANNYVDATISNVVISGKEDVHVALVTLHQ
ncbi:MAG TPA: DUF4382 domain-containing protein [Puia sp.]|nr:DUF4382 domain-containing protein [Puia sp.]